MSELIGIREAGRRIGVSDTAVRKAIAAGRVKVAGHTEKSNRPLLAWPDCETDWNANSDASKRTHIGSQGSPRRAKYGKPPEDDVKIHFEPQAHGGALKRNEAVPANMEFDGEGNVAIHDAMTLNEAKTAKAIYDARLARIDYEEQQRILVKAEEVRSQAFKLARGARDELMTIEDRLSPILASETDLTAVRSIIREEIRRVCERISMGADKA
jgi:hypothetical protein